MTLGGAETFTVKPLARAGDAAAASATATRPRTAAASRVSRMSWEQCIGILSLRLSGRAWRYGARYALRIAYARDPAPLPQRVRNCFLERQLDGRPRGSRRTRPRRGNQGASPRC